MLCFSDKSPLDLLSVVCFFLHVACQKKKSLSNFLFSALCIFTFTFSNTVRESTHTRTGTKTFILITRTGLFFPHQRHSYPLAILPSTYNIQAAPGKIFPNNFSMLRNFHTGVFVLLTTHYHPTSTVLPSDLALKSSLFLFSPVRYQIHYRTGMLPI